MAQENTQTYKYSNETFSGCDMVASISISNAVYNQDTKSTEMKTYNKVVGELQTVSYSIHMEKRPIRSIGNVNAKDYVMGPRTIAGSLVFSVFNKHFSQDLIENINKNHTAGTVYLVDELPPFDIIISAANEYGYRSKLAIYGIRLLNEGQVMSINDVFTENTYQFFATDLAYLTDEMEYTRSANEKLYKLTDTIDYINTDSPNVFYNAALDTTTTDYLNKLSSEPVTLTVSAKQPTRANNKGIVDFFLSPAQQSGTIYVTDADDEETKIKIKAGDSLVTYVSSIFYPGTYTAYFINDSDKKSNTVKFVIKKYRKSSTSVTMTPVIDKLTSTSVTISTSNSKHNKVLLSTLANGDLDSYNITNKKAKIKNLDPNSTYNVRTYNSDDNDSSKTISFKTLGDYEAYEDLISYLKANKKVLSIEDSISDYVNLVEDNEDPDLTPSEAISKAKSNYTNALAVLDLGSSTYKEDKLALEKKILMSSLILTVSIKMNNNTVSAINKSLNVPAPTFYLDENYDNIFQFDENITSAEFFRDYDSIEQYAATISSYNFKTINGKTNCFKFIGKPGVKHYVQAIISNVRSTKVEFYVMTAKEKEAYINKDIIKDTMSASTISKLNATVDNDLEDTISTIEQQRAFLVNAKKISNDKITAPTILSIDTDVIVQTFLNNITNNDTTFYLAIATYNDIVNNNDIYKVPFSSKDTAITISPLSNGIKENAAYALWIENSEGVQLSNVTTFVYIPGTDPVDNITKYESKDFIEIINTIAKKELPVDIQDVILGTIENNEDITINEIVSAVIDILSTNVIPKVNLLNFLYSIKKYIGIFSDIDNSFINNINYNTSTISFDSSKTGTILIYDLDQILNINLENSNAIQLNNYQSNIVIIVAIENSLNSKSNILIINKNEKYMEVL
jgi:hypothetical protein